MLNEKKIEKALTPEAKEYFKEKAGIVAKFKGNIKALRQIKKLITKTLPSLCDACRAKVVKNPRIGLDEYCPDCRNIVEERANKIKEKLK